MSGQLSLLTPIASPMVTRPTSPAAAGEKQHGIDYEEWWTAGQTAKTAMADAAAGSDTGLIAAAAVQAAAHSHASTGDQHMAPAWHKKWRSPPCCDGCGAAKASAGQCSGCMGHFCALCMSASPCADNPAARAPAHSDFSPAGSCSSSPSSMAHVTIRTACVSDPCNHCSSLCNSCKPVACCFCEQVRQQASATKLCEACAGVCDACQRAACGPCRAGFGGCSSCGYAVCEDCRLQLQLQYGGGGSGRTSAGVSLVGPSGAVSCWCAPPLRLASSVRHISNQRFQMAQLHPSVLAATMEAAGLRDADYDDEDDVSYEEGDDVMMSHTAAETDVDHHGAGTSSSANGGSLGHRAPSQGFTGLLCSKALETTIGSLPGMAGHLGLPLSPSSSSHSSMGQYGSAGQQHLGPGLAAVLGSAGGLRQGEGSLRSWVEVGLARQAAAASL